MIKQEIPTDPIPPGETLLETFEGHDMTQADFSRRSGLSTKTISQIISGKEPITQSTALVLERILKVPAYFWTNLEARYRENLARLAEADSFAQHQDWARTFPYAEMAKRGLVPVTRKAAEKVGHLLDFLAVRTPDQWQKVYAGKLPELSFRRSETVAEKTAGLSIWLRIGELVVEKAEVAEFDPIRFAEVLHEAREMTRLCPGEFIPELEKRCADAGVVYTLVKEFPGLGVSGVMRWHRGRPVIQQTLRFKTNDHFWFTFLHEGRHVLQKRKKAIFLEGKAVASEDREREDDANRFARDLLIPAARWQEFRKMFPQPVSREIKDFATGIGVHPGIVAGRLFREKVLDYAHPARHLQVKFEWAES